MRAEASVTSPFEPDLAKLRAWLEEQIRSLRFLHLVTAIVSLVTRMARINADLTRQVWRLRKGNPRSETLARIEAQLLLFAFQEMLTETKPETEKDPKKTKRSRKGVHPGRGAFPARLPRVPVHNPVVGPSRYCPLCGAEMRTVSHSMCESLEVRPAEVFVKQRLDETVACPNDDTIVSASPPPQIVEKGKLGDGLIVEAVADKYLDHLPVERQCQRFERIGIEIAPQTLGRGVNAAIDLLMPIAKLIEGETRGPGLLGTDATGIPILDRDAPLGIRNGAMWCWTNALWVSFFYSKSGDSESVRRFLGDDLARTVQCDGTSTLSFIERAGGKRPGCWSHGRRRFVEAARQGDRIAVEGLRLIAPLFAVEHASKIEGESATQRRARRDGESRPILEKLRVWLDERRGAIPPETVLGKALTYLHRQWPRLILFLDDGNIELTNNRRERELRRLVLGRRNWLFTWLDEGGERTAAILTILATCIAHDINPRAYLHVVTKLIVYGWPNAHLRDLLPDRILKKHPNLFIGDPLDLPEAPELALLLHRMLPPPR